ncbi:hypothetical protein A3C96_02485 [Candidatus Uhrbacteria bacterium RIFCSPHIGHO2_02_FULL_60_10]|uniref:Uncharacterized protein n=1 Tax=Candidatus Uhrbacteria bacterium RIFCSPHIGHO2_02_FULL_60_10 TaxID=1802392 RepID=A0A1F7U6N4_9BACT|nr:MAG: hypothetical protein A3C96_02485 [Candidatus Uhrbacteria bacterium RIFCSPHIGHO2_02_FULL_60_10]
MSDPKRVEIVEPRLARGIFLGLVTVGLVIGASSFLGHRLFADQTVETPLSWLPTIVYRPEIVAANATAPTGAKEELPVVKSSEDDGEPAATPSSEGVRDEGEPRPPQDEPRTEPKNGGATALSLGDALTGASAAGTGAPAAIPAAELTQATTGFWQAAWQKTWPLLQAVWGWLLGLVV